MQVQYLQQFKGSHWQLLNLVNLESGPFAEPLRQIEKVTAERESLRAMLKNQIVGMNYAGYW
ncbi:hypothetical protein [Arenicella xantha]|uniref:Uncharacterized protein n=1 Tax=Arenicella xantha TaxID=644221 RepID=A0A395JJT2_9GAMM|nr:hypothetical protein [Arenicella xantha]RBP51043.1 hypothetical protein DFR28_102462 [Arenicella xantha]